MTIQHQAIEATCTGIPDPYAILDAWKHSRPNETNPRLASVMKVDAPVNEMTHFTLELCVPILLREVICSIREHIVWARTSRVDDLTVWPIWTGAVDPFKEQLKKLYDKMMVERERKEQQDHFRMNLPLSYMTRLTVRLSLRSLVKLLSSIRKLGKDHPGLFAQMCDELHNRITEAVINTVSVGLPREEGGVKVWNKVPFTEFDGALTDLIATDGYGVEELCPLLTETSPYDSGFKIGGFVYVELHSISIALRAQLVRHRPLAIRDQLRLFFRDESMFTTIGAQLGIEVMMPIEVARTIMKKRNCWIAQADLWEPFIRQVRNALADETPSLPCDGGTCPYVRDNELRLEDKDPGAPCPRYANLTKKPLNYSHTAQARAVAEQRPDRNFWKKEMLS